MADAAAYGRIELARTAHIPGSREAVLDAVGLLAQDIERIWRQEPPSFVVIWERRRALGGLVARQALEADVPVVTVQNGFGVNTMLVDRLVSEESTLLQVRPLLEGMHELPHVVWRRPARFGVVADAHRTLASAGLWVDYGEKLAKAAFGYPSLVPLGYWHAFARDRVGKREPPNDVVPFGARFALLALHTPAINGWGADPLEFAALVLQNIPAGLPLVICPHPGDRQAGQLAVLRAMADRRADTFLAARSPAWPLLDDCDLLITMSSAIGLEALCRGIPTLALPSAYYARPGLAIPLDPLSPHRIAEVAALPSAFRPNPAAVTALMCTLEREHLVARGPHQSSSATANDVATIMTRLASWQLPPVSGQDHA